MPTSAPAPPPAPEPEKAPIEQGSRRFEFTTDHQFYFKTETEVTASALAESLLGLEGVVLRSLDVVRALVPEVTFEDVEVLVSSIEIGSYKDNIIVRLLWGKEDEAEKNIEKFRKALKLKKMEPKTLIAIAIAGAIVYGAVSFVKPKDAGTTIHIENSFNTLGAKAGVSPEELKKLVESALEGKKEELRKNMVKLIHPTGEQSTGSIAIDENDPAVNIQLPAEVSEAVPPQYEKKEVKDLRQEIEDVQLVIRAGNLDSSTQGWSAIAAELTERKLAVHFEPEVNIASIQLGKYIHADITMISKVGPKGQKTPKLIIVRKVRQKGEYAPSAAAGLKEIQKSVSDAGANPTPAALPPTAN